ncbi:MAG: glutamine amidotransferase [Eubacteriales bacterium]|nr:glutamine amidotransferase [Eubacteriales bacterium]
MELKMAWMYPDIMDLYGDRGNVAALRYRCRQRAVECTVDHYGMGDTVDFSAYDLVFIGGGADKEQRLLAQDLYRHRAAIERALDTGTFFLLICGAYQLFGTYYIDAAGHKVNGLGLYPYRTEAGGNGRRCIGNIAVEAVLDGVTMQVVGFENHGGQTMGVDHPFGRVLHGRGNHFGARHEGYCDGRILGTYMHGPLLPKNPALTDGIIRRALRTRYGTVTLPPMDDSLEQRAHDIMMERMMKAKRDGR